MKNQKSVVFTDRSDNSINLLFKDIRKYPVLKADKEKDALERMINGDMRSRELLINSNLRLVMSMAKQYTWSGISQGDLFQTGVIGLIQAVNKYESSKSNCFIAYAMIWIDSELKKAVTEQTRQTYGSLEEKAFDRDDCTCTLGDMISAGSECNPDWNIRCEEAIDSLKAEVKHKYCGWKANLWADYVMMREQGYALHDIAQKYRLPDEMVKSLIKDINHSLTTH